MSGQTTEVSDQVLLFKLLAEWSAYQSRGASYPFSLSIGASDVAADVGEFNELVCSSLTVGEETLSEAVLGLLSDITANAAEINVLDGCTASTAEINILDGVTASTAELNILDGVTASAAELNILDGVTASATNINVLAGTSLTSTKHNNHHAYLDNLEASYADLNTLVGGGSTTLHLHPGLAGLPRTHTDFFDWTVFPVWTNNTVQNNWYEIAGANGEDYSRVDGYELRNGQRPWVDGVSIWIFLNDVIRQLHALMSELKAAGIINYTV